MPMPVSLVKSLDSSTSALAGSQAAQHSVRSSACAAFETAVDATTAEASPNAIFKLDFMPSSHLRNAPGRRFQEPSTSLLRGPNMAAPERGRCLVICLVMQFLLNNASEFVAA